MANASLTPFIRAAESLCRYCGGMDTLFIAGRHSLSDAEELIRDFGPEAGLQAAVLAERSREAENILKFCHWRQVERLIDLLSVADSHGTIH